MSDSLKISAKLFLFLGVIACAYWLFSAYQLYHSSNYDFISNEISKTIQNNSIGTTEEKLQILKPFYNERSSIESAARMDIYFGIASIISGFISYLLLFSQGIILKRSEYTEELFEMERKKKLS